MFITAVQTKHEGYGFFLGFQNLFFFHEAIILAHLQNFAPCRSGQILCLYQSNVNLRN
jgi:hypothetical protein